MRTKAGWESAFDVDNGQKMPDLVCKTVTGDAILQSTNSQTLSTSESQSKSGESWNTQRCTSASLLWVQHLLPAYSIETTCPRWAVLQINGSKGWREVSCCVSIQEEYLTLLECGVKSPTAVKGVGENQLLATVRDFSSHQKLNQ